MRFFEKMSIRRKILAVLLIVSLLSLLINTGVAYMSISSLRSLAENANKQLGSESADSSMRALEEQAVSDLGLLVTEKVGHIGTKLDTLEKQSRFAAYYISNIYHNPEAYTPVIPDMVNDIRNKDILTLQYSLSPGVSYDSIREEIETLSAIKYVFDGLTEENNNILTIYYGSESGWLISYDGYSGYSDSIYFEHRERSWYEQAKETDSIVWTDVYRDSYDRGMVITCAMPVYDADGRFMGAFGMDVSLTDLDTAIIDSKIGKNGYTFMIDAQGKLLSSPNYEEKNLLDDPNSDFTTVIRKMTLGETGHSLLNYSGEDIYISYAPLPDIQWSIGVVLPREEIIEPALETSEMINRNSEAIIKRMNQSIMRSLILFAFLFVVVILFVVGTSLPFSRRITSPIAELVKGVKAIGGGNLDYPINILTGDEIGTLAAAFFQMTSALKHYVDNLAKVTAEKERIGAELSIATTIQASMLPCIFPAFPGRSEFDIYATMRPAKEVGGDFYDFFLIDNDHLGVVMADVSGKGVPAALFMVIAKTLIKNNTQAGKSPREILETVNNQLCENNDADMFVTVFLGVLEISTGRFTYANAGHNPPLLCRAGCAFDWLPTKRGLVLAAMPFVHYRQDEIILAKDDVLFLYTDGVTEATDRNNNLFSDPKLLRDINKYKDKELSVLLAAIKREIDHFADGAEQADDITMMALKIFKVGDKQ